jgi:hypothetical protein
MHTRKSGPKHCLARSAPLVRPNARSPIHPTRPPRTSSPFERELHSRGVHWYVFSFFSFFFCYLEVLINFVLQIAFDSRTSPPIHPYPTTPPIPSPIPSTSPPSFQAERQGILLRVSRAVCRIKSGDSTLHCSRVATNLPSSLPSPPKHQKPTGLTADGLLRATGSAYLGFVADSYLISSPRVVDFVSVAISQ